MIRFISSLAASCLLMVLCLPLCWSAEAPSAAADAYQRAVAAIEQRAEHDWPSNRNLQPCSVSHDPGENDVTVQRLDVQDAQGHELEARGALIHHWRASILIPGATPEDVSTVLREYDRHAQFYAPEVTNSKLLDRQGLRYRVLHETLSRSVITVGLRIESVMDWHRVAADNWWSHGATVRVTEMEHAGTPRATERTPQEAKGWLWRMDSWWHITAQGNGACVTYENIALTRDVPWGLGWILRPIIARYPAETMTNMLRRTRSAVLSQRANNNREADQGKSVSAR